MLYPFVSKLTVVLDFRLQCCNILQNVHGSGGSSIQSNVKVTGINIWYAQNALIDLCSIMRHLNSNRYVQTGYKQW